MVFNDHGAEERICTLSWAEELRFYQCNWRDSLHRSTIEVNAGWSVQLSDALWTRNKSPMGKRVEDGRKNSLNVGVWIEWLLVMI